MKYESATILLALLDLASAVPVPEARNKFKVPTFRLRGREVPQEHSHERFLTGVRTNLALNNPSNIQDPVFGLLGNAAAAAGAGSITNLDCLHQATADQAFTNAKAANNVTGMVDALSYAALERNTGGVGVASVICNETAVNPEIAAVQQHQDPASPGAAATNKAVVLALAKQIATVGGNPQDALLTGTFAPGQTSDPTGAGNTCDVSTDPVGCIFTQNLIVNDATADEITAAAGASSSAAGAATSSGSSASNSTAASGSASNSSASACGGSVVTGTTTVDAPAATSPAAASSASAVSTGAASTSALNFGSCSDPAILFENGLDGRTQEAFIAANQQDFNHGSALGIGVISSFICQQLNDKCKASADTLTACTAGQTAAAAATGQAAADAFNSALGVSGASSSSASSSSGASSSASSASSGASSASATSAAPASTGSSAASSSSSSAATTSSNVQTFTGALGGPPPAVSEGTGTRPFTVNGDTFVGEGAALQRSCSIQHNACANAANAGGASFSVSDCETQETACNAAASA